MSELAEKLEIDNETNNLEVPQLPQEPQLTIANRLDKEEDRTEQIKNLAAVRYTKELWALIQIDYEAGLSQAELCRKYDMHKATISRRIKNHGWVQSHEPVIHAKADKILAGTVGLTDDALDEALDKEAQRRANITAKHREQWIELTDMVKSVIGNKQTDKATFEKMKTCKISSETITLIQAGERKAHKLDMDDSTAKSSLDLESRLDAAIESAAKTGVQSKGGEVETKEANPKRG